MTAHWQAASGSQCEPGLGAIGTVVCILTGEHFRDLSVALERAGCRTALRADIASALEEPNAAAIDSVVLVDTQLLQTRASFNMATALATAMPLALLMRPEPGQDMSGLTAIPAVAALPFPPDPAVLIASLPYWRARHQEYKALKDVEYGLQLALVGSRSIGNAVGMMAERHGISMDDAFDMIRGSARSSRQRVEQVARDITDEAAGATARRPDGGIPASADQSDKP